MSQDNVFLFLRYGHSIPGTPTVSGCLQAVGPPRSTAAWQVDEGHFALVCWGHFALDVSL